MTSKFRYILYLNFDVKRFEKYSLSYGASHIWWSTGKNVTFHRKKGTLQNVWRWLWRQTFWKVLPFLWSITYLMIYRKKMWRSIGKRVLYKTFDVKVQVQNVPELWRQTFWNMSFSCSSSHFRVQNSNTTCQVIMWRSVGKGVLFKTFDVKVQVQNVPELWRQTFCKVLLFL